MDSHMSLIGTLIRGIGLMIYKLIIKRTKLRYNTLGVVP